MTLSVFDQQNLVNDAFFDLDEAVERWRTASGATTAGTARFVTMERKGRKGLVANTAGAPRSAHVSLAIAAITPPLVAAYAKVCAALTAIPALNHPTQEPTITVSAGTGTVIVSICKTPRLSFPLVRDVEDYFVALTETLEGLTVTPNDPVWSIGAARFGAPDAGTAVVLRAGLTTGNVVPKTLKIPASVRRIETITDVRATTKAALGRLCLRGISA